jgi:hypothetical protein
VIGSNDVRHAEGVPENLDRPLALAGDGFGMGGVQVAPDNVQPLHRVRSARAARGRLGARADV